MTKASTTIPNRVNHEPIHHAGRQASTHVSTTTIERVPKSVLQRVVTSPQTAKPRAIRALSHFSGNRAIAGLIQASPENNPDEFSYEQQAIQAAGQITADPSDGTSTTPKNPPLIQRQGEDGFKVSPEINLHPHHLQDRGNSLPASVRSRMESSFDADFSPVRLQHVAKAATLNQRIQAKAFTFDKDIFLGQHADALASVSGQKLLAVEGCQL